MAKYGTIVILYDKTDENLQAVHEILEGHEIVFLSKENTLFFKTLSKRNRNEISKQLNEKGLTFILFHNNNSDGDKIKEGNIANSERDLIRRLIIEE